MNNIEGLQQDIQDPQGTQGTQDIQDIQGTQGIQDIQDPQDTQDTQGRQGTQGTLYLVPTPIGNLEDMTYRAVRTLEEADVIAAEDTRHTGLLLKHFGIAKQLISYHEHNKHVAGIELLGLLEEGKKVALVSDAGMPAISDPGADMVQLCIERDIPIVPLPGANAGLTALIASGLDTTEFTFLGFLPKRTKKAKELLARLRTYPGTLIFYEAPHRLYDTLETIYESFGNRRITVGRELTKKFETFTRATLDEIISSDVAITIRGEFVLIIEGYTNEYDEAREEVRELTYLEQVVKYMDDGYPKKEAIRQVAKDCGVARRDVYNYVEQFGEDLP